MISVKNVSYSHGKNNPKIFNNFSIDIQKGEFISILGRTGCGKTTLANLLCGYLQPDSGFITINGERDNVPNKRKVMVNQENDLFGWMTVRENMALANQDSKNILKLLRLVMLDDKLENYPGSLSGGMKKRISFARALSANPDILVLDEPFSYLDFSTKIDLLKQFKKIAKETKTTTVLITHDIDESLYLSDRIVVLGGNPVEIAKDVQLGSKKLSNSRRFAISNQIKKSY